MATVMMVCFYCYSAGEVNGGQGLWDLSNKSTSVIALSGIVFVLYTWEREGEEVEGKEGGGEMEGGDGKKRSWESRKASGSMGTFLI